MLKELGFLAIAGAIGTICRYGLAGLVQRICGASFPWGTLTVNAVGCLLFGVVWTLAEERLVISGQVRFVALTGFMGAFTTFSTFAFETGEFLRDAEWFGSLSTDTTVSRKKQWSRRPRRCCSICSAARPSPGCGRSAAEHGRRQVRLRWLRATAALATTSQNRTLRNLNIAVVGRRGLLSFNRHRCGGGTYRLGPLKLHFFRGVCCFFGHPRCRFGKLAGDLLLIVCFHLCCALGAFGADPHPKQAARRQKQDAEQDHDDQNGHAGLTALARS
jgi:CrcB protein